MAGKKTIRRKLAALASVLALPLALGVPASAILFGGDEEATVTAFTKNGLTGGTILFSADDFQVEGNATLQAIIVESLPDTAAGRLTMGEQPITVGDRVDMAAVEALCFTTTTSAGGMETAFSFQPVFQDGTYGKEVTVGLHLLAAENGTPIAENLTFTTYKNVAVTERFAAVDPEGDILSFRLVDKPARGAVTIAESGDTFVYTPYENKTGKDTFTYVAVDAVGNTSPAATVKVEIKKPATKVSYADMDGDPSHKAAIRLAEEGIFVGENIGGAYFFHSGTPVSRSEFLTMAMNTVGTEALEGVTRTGFSDDDTIPTWAKGYVSAALKVGLVEGTVDSDSGQVVFQPENTVTRAEASVILSRALQMRDAAASGSYTDLDTEPVWAVQSAVNLERSGVLQTSETGALMLQDTLTRGDAAQMLCGALELLDSRQESGL